MLKALRDVVIARVQQRVSEGDCPTIPAESVETLENVILDLIAETSPLSECAECGGTGRIETGEMERGPAGIGYETANCAECDGTGSTPSP